MTRRRLSAERELIDDLLAHTISAASLVGTGSSAAAASQVLSTVSTLTGDPDSLSESSQTGAIGLLGEVVGDAAKHGIDDDTAASAADTVSSLLDASLFASGASNTYLDGNMTGTVGAPPPHDRGATAARTRASSRTTWSSVASTADAGRGVSLSPGPA